MIDIECLLFSKHLAQVPKVRAAQHAVHLMIFFEKSALKPWI
jgi:hypothetical protein